MTYRYSKGSRDHDALMSATENRAMFEHIASFYDGTNKILSLGLDGYWRRKAVEYLRPAPESHYLDVGCGTGDVAIEILRAAENVMVTGIDPSSAMLAVGRKKVSEAGLNNNIRLIDGDALDIPFQNSSFDGAITSFCIRNVPYRLRAVKEIHRVIKPGGRFIILELTEPLGPIMRPLFRIYGKVVMPAVTYLMSSVSAYRYLTDSMADFPHPDVFLKLLSDSGFEQLDYRHLTGGIVTIFTGVVP